jgi:hypothetical protein
MTQEQQPGPFRRWRRARQKKKLEQVERDYGNMSAKERFDLDRLREEHSPFMGRGGAGHGGGW